MEVVEAINWNSSKNLVLRGNVYIPTIVMSNAGELLGLAYSTRESLKLAIETKKGIYYSRTREFIWEKGLNMRNHQVLLKVKWDCDSDALVFVVKQRGEFCHIEGCNSCFINEMVVSQDSPVKISYATGHCEQITFDFLKKIGIMVHKSTDRTKDFSVKSDLGNFELESWKPKDIGMAIGRADFIIYYKEFMGRDTLRDIEENFITLRLPRFKPMKVCLVGKPNTIIGHQSKICTEYPAFNETGYNYITTHGNSEEYVKKGFCDAAVVIVSTGKTLTDTGLMILKEIATSDISLMVSKEFYKSNPRLVREIRNVMESNYLYFYSVDGPNGVFSNFYPCKFIDSNGLEWRSSEHYYQAHKFTDPRLFNIVKNTKTCKECYKVSWSYKDSFRPDWIDVKDNIMWDALRYKFRQNPKLMEALVKTGDKILVERCYAENDFHYGMGLENNGKNMLGKLLMKLRDESRSRL